MDRQELVKKTLDLNVLLVISVLLLWSVAASTSPASQELNEAQQSNVEIVTFYRDINSQVARTKKARKGRCLLSLDGGGMLALSQIAILYEISNRIKHDLRLQEPPRLCNYFDMIGGVGTGGLLAILIGCLGLTVHQAEKEYLKVIACASSALMDPSGLNRTLRATVKKYTGSSETLMYTPHSQTSHCKTFVGTAAAANMSQLIKFRSYESRRGQEANLPIWQVARATIAYPGLFPPIQAGPGSAPITYMSGEVGWSNPSTEVIREFEAEWKGQGILCFASIGAGYQGIIQIDISNESNTLNSAMLEKMATDSRRVEEEIEHRFMGQNNYFRLSVEQGLQRAEGRTTTKPEDVVVHTRAYLGSAWVDNSVDRLLDSLLRAIEVLPWQTTRESFEQNMREYIRNAQACIGEITNNDIKKEVLEVISTLELIQAASSHEEEWLRLAKVMYSHMTFIARDIAPKIWKPLSEDPLWPPTNKYTMELRQVHKNAKELMKMHCDQVWKTPTGESLPRRWAMGLEECFKGIQRALSSEIHNQLASSRKRQQEEDREKLLSWLSSLQPQRRHEEVKAKRSKGTGTWFLNSSTFQTWFSIQNIQTSHVLWSAGAPGVGKTILCSSVIKYLYDAAAKLNIGVIYVYCDYRDKDNQTAVNIIGSFAKQLVLQASSIPATVWEMRKQKAERHEEIDLETAEEMVNVLLPCFDCVYICIDALDEFQPEPRRQLLDFFQRLTGTTLHLFLTGRPSVEAEVNSALRGIPISTIPIAANEEDIRISLSEKFDQDRYPEAMDDSLKAEISNKIVRLSQGIFLLSMLQAEAILEHDTKRDRRETLFRVPAKLSETYNATLERIKQQPETRSQRAWRILTWVYYAERPLRVEELRHALAVKDGDTSFDSDGMPLEKALVDCCLGLVVIERETSTIRLTHFTLQEYFDNHREALLPSGHTIIATTCLTYVEFDHTGKTLQKLTESSPFIEYIGQNLGHHLRKGSDTAMDQQTLSMLFKQDKIDLLERFLEVLQSPQRHRLGELKTSPLHWAAYFGISSVARLILETTGNPNLQDSPGKRTPLYWAARNGHVAVVQLLIDTSGIDLNLRDKYGQTPLYWAARNGHVAVVRLMINTPGVDLNPRDDDQTPLYWAVKNGHDAVIQLLIGTPGVDLNPRDKHGQTPLSLAALNGHVAVVQLLISTPGINLNLRDKCDQTPLSLAASNGHDAVVQLLISASGVDLNSRNNHGQTPLSLAAINGHDTVVQLLINNLNVDLNTRDHIARTPLSWAARNGHDTVVRLMISTRGVDFNPIDCINQTPFSLAARNGHEAVVRLLTGTPG